ncbi:P-loop NTPase [Acanthopleuribacter pedis]|uniref:AAA+ ATPase domain-containing protein n=1 Tax=Acanthopleuribacter pedis TaxID=442870 RepID=A0A8J7U3Y7_9BACT|nr:ATPase, T2SS/T4P/T4SS family [Acanthopleuribacter pedis]MBO1319259.1 hypothetical protein [Acanthopleuribacter pedis]
MAHDDLIQRVGLAARTGRLVLFLGDAPALSLEFPSLDTAMEHLADAYLENEELDADRKGRVTKYREEQDWPRLTKTLHDHDSELYETRVKSALAGPHAGATPVLPWWLQTLLVMEPVLIITSDRGPLPAATIPRGYTLTTWQDAARITQLPQPGKHHLVAVNGCSLIPGSLLLTLDDEHVFKGPAGDPVRALLQKVQRDYLCLWVGFREDDPFLVTQFEDPTLPLENQVMITPSGKYRTVLKNQALWVEEDAGLGLSTTAKSLIAAAEREPPPDWEHISETITSQSKVMRFNELVCLPNPSRKEILAYYQGHPATWSLVRENHSIPRRETQEVLDFLNKGRKTVLVSGPTGTGKSTILMQAALKLLEDDYTVLHLDAPRTIDRWLSPKQGKLAVLVDDGSRYYGLAQLVHKAETRSNVVVLIAARTHEWINMLRFRRQANLAAMAKVRVKELLPAELEHLGEKLTAAGAYKTNTDQKQLVADLTLHLGESRDLLAAMLMATTGLKLVAILRKAIEEIASWTEGKTLLELLGTIVFIESLPTKSGIPLTCSARLLCHVLGLSPKAVSAALERLRGEVRPRQNLYDELSSRDQIISQQIYRILFEGANPFLAKVDIGALILWAANLIAREETKKHHLQLMSMVPNHFWKLGDYQTAEALFEAATRIDPSNPIVWQNWARMAKEPNAKPHLHLSPDPRILFEKATQADPKDAPSWQAWAVMEHKAGNIEIARSLFEQAIQADPSHALSWQAWAVMEAKHGLPHEARKRFHQATQVDPNQAPSWQAWAIFEAEQLHYAEAREYFKQAICVDAGHAPSWRAWVAMELDLGHVERAQHLIEKACETCPAYEFEGLRRRLEDGEKPVTPPTNKSQKPKNRLRATVQTQFVSWVGTTKKQAGISEYMAYLAANAIKKKKQAGNDERFLALAMIVPHLRKPLLREAESTRLPAAPAFILTLPARLDPNPLPENQTRCFAVTHQGQVFTWLAAAPSHLYGPVPEPCQPQPIFQVPGFDPMRGRVLGLYLGPAGTFSQTTNLFLVVQLDAEPRLYQFSLTNLGDHPLAHTEFPEWMQKHPLSGRPGSQVGDFHQVISAQPMDDSATWSTLWQGRLWHLAAAGFYDNDRLHGIQAAVNDQTLYVLRTDQSIALYTMVDGKPVRHTRRFFRRQPVAIAALPTLEGEPPRLLVGYRNGQVRVCVDVASAQGADWGETCWHALENAYSSQAKLRTLADWPAWLDDFEMGRVPHEVCRHQAALQVACRMFFAFLLRQPNLNLDKEWSIRKWLNPPLDTFDYLPLLQILRVYLRNLSNTADPTGAAGFLEIYESLPHELREILDTYIHEYDLSQTVATRDAGGADNDAITQLIQRSHRTRRAFLTDPKVTSAAKASILAEIQLGFPITEYFAKQTTQSGPPRLLPTGQPLFVWDDGVTLQTMTLDSNTPRAVLQPRPGMPSLFTLQATGRELSLIEVMPACLRRHRMDDSGSLETTDQEQHFPQPIQPIRAVDAGEDKLLILTRQNNLTYGFRLDLWCTTGAGKLEGQLNLRHHPLVCVAFHIVTPGKEWHIALSSGEREWTLYTLTYQPREQKLSLSQPIRYRTRGNVTALTFGEVQGSTWILVGSDRGHLQAFEQDEDANNRWRLKWLHTTATEIRGLHLLAADHHCRILAFTSQGEVFVFTGSGEPKWHRHCHVSLVAGCLLPPTTKTNQIFSAVLCDARGALGVLSFEEQKPWETIVKEFRTTTGIEPKPPYDEYPRLQDRHLHPVDLACLAGDRETSENHRALALQDFAEKILQLDLPTQAECRGIKISTKSWHWPELARLVRFDGRIAAQDNRLWLIDLSLDLLNRLYEEDQAQRFTDTSDLRGTRILADLIRGLGRDLLTPLFLSEGNIPNWTKVPTSLRHTPAVNAAIIANLNLNPKDPNLFGKLVTQASFLGPQAFDALVLLAPTQNCTQAWLFGELVARKQYPVPSSEKHHHTLPPGFAGVLWAFGRFLWGTDQPIKPLLQAAETLVRAGRAKVENQFHPDLAVIYDWLAPLAVIHKMWRSPKTQQLQTLAEIGAITPKEPVTTKQTWRQWLVDARDQFLSRRRIALDQYRETLLHIIRLRLEHLDFVYQTDNRAQLRFQPKLDGEQTLISMDFRVTLKLKCKDHQNPLETLAIWSWDQIPEETQTYELEVPETCIEAVLLCETLDSDEVQHSEPWPVALPQKNKEGSHQLLRGVPSLVTYQVGSWIALEPGLHLLAYDPDIGITPYTETAEQQGIQLVDLDGGFGGYDGKMLSAKKLLEHVDWHTQKQATQSQKPLKTLVFNTTRTITQMLDEPGRPVIQSLLAQIKEKTWRASCWLVPKSEAFRLSGVLGEQARLIPLFAPQKLPIEVRRDLIAWLASRTEWGESTLAAVLEALGLNLSLLVEWLKTKEPISEFLENEKKAKDLLIAQFRGLSPLALANLIVLVFCRTWFPSGKPIPVEATSIRNPDHEQDKPEKPQSEPLDHSLSGLTEDTPFDPSATESLDSEGSWLRGYEEHGERNPDPDILNGLRDLGDTLQENERNRCRHLLKNRGILAINQGLVFLRQPYQAILEHWIEPDSWGREFAEDVLQAPLFKKLDFKALAVPGEQIRYLVPKMTQQGLDALKELGSENPNWETLVHRLTGINTPALKPEELSEPELRFYEDIRARLDSVVIFPLETTHTGPLESPQETHWLVFIVDNESPDQGWWSNMVGNHTTAVNLIFVCPSIQAISAEKSQRLSFIDAQALKEIVAGADVANTFWLHVRYRVGLLKLNPFETGAPLDPGSETFVGRKQETEHILSLIANQSFLIIGGRKIGKTSLLNHIAGVLDKKPDHTPLFVDVQDVYDANMFIERFGAACQKAGIQYIPADDPAESLGATVSHLPGPVLLLNEIDGLALDDHGFLKTLRRLSQQGECQFVMVGYQGAHGGLARLDSPLHNWFPTDEGRSAIILGRLEDDAAYQLIDLLEKSRLRLTYDNPELRSSIRKEIYNATQGIPKLIQEECDRIVKNLDKRQSPVITKEDFARNRDKHGIWDFYQKIETPFLLASQRQIQPHRLNRPRQEHNHMRLWRYLLLSTMVHHLYSDIPAYMDGKAKLNHVLSGNLYFTSNQARNYTLAVLEQEDSTAFAIARKEFSLDVCKDIFDYLALTVFVGVEVSEMTRYYFSDHLFPIGLRTYLTGENTSLTTYLKKLATEFGESLSELETNP